MCQFYFVQNNLLYDESHKHMTLESFRPGNPSQAEALVALKGFEVGKDGICLYGDSGRGKTHLALGVAHQATKKGHIVLAIKSIDLLNRIKRTYDKKDDASEADIMFALKNVDLLVIDEVGIEKTTEWVTAKFYEVIDSRHKRRSTIFTTNFTGNQLKEKEGMALVSRMWGTGMRFEIQGKDWRVA
jgi:DNA replication protein DnaC